MRANAARTIDYWLGIFICFIFSFAYKIEKIITGNTFQREPPSKIMFMGFAEMGSIILAYPAIKKVKDRYPSAKLYFWTFEENLNIVNIIGLIPESNIFLIRNQNLLAIFFDVLENLKKIRREGIDLAIDFELFSRFSSILGYLSKAKSKVGFNKYKMEGLYRGDLHTHKVIYNHHIHISQNFIALVEAATLKGPFAAPLLRKVFDEGKLSIPKTIIQKDTMANFWIKLKSKNQSINPDSKIVVMRFDFDDRISVRMWPDRHYLSLIKKLLEKEDIYIVLIGVKPNVSRILTIGERCINLIGETTIADLLCLFNISKVLVGHDGGTLHLASMSNIHIIALFGPESHLLYGPLTENVTFFYKNLYCSPCLSAYNHRNTICQDNKCMQEININEVYEGVIRMIS